MLMADPSSPTKSKGRRKSAFAEEDEGYQYVEEGFRIRFANGETIDFYADSREHKDQWMVALTQVIGRPDPGHKAATWTDLVLAREQAGDIIDIHSTSPQKASVPEVKDFGRPAPAPAPPSMPRQNSHRKPVGSGPGSGSSGSGATGVRPSSKSAPNSPMKGTSPTKSRAPMPPAPAPKERPKTPPMNARRGHRSRDAVKSMIF